jgi:hypothetical protein
LTQLPQLVAVPADQIMSLGQVMQMLKAVDQGEASIVVQMCCQEAQVTLHL